MLDQLVRRDDGARATGVIFEIGLDVLEDDPYPIYEWMRRELPIAFVPEVGRVLITTWDLCTEAGTNDEVFGPTQHPFSEVYGLPNVMSLTGQAHRTLRNSLNPPFRPRAVNEYRERCCGQRRSDTSTRSAAPAAPTSPPSCSSRSACGRSAT